MSSLSMPRLSHLSYIALVFCTLLFGGCGGPKLVTAKGTVTKNGQPIPLGNGYVEITLIPDVPEGAPMTTRPGRVDATGNFVIDEVPPGKYKVTIEHRDPTPADDKLNGEFDRKRTKIVREVDGKTPITIELTGP